MIRGVGACPSGTALSSPSAIEPASRLAPDGLQSHGARVADFIDHLASFETPAMRAVRRMAQQIREQEA